MNVDAALQSSRIARLLATETQNAGYNRIMSWCVCPHDLSGRLTSAEQGPLGQAFADDIDDFQPARRREAGVELITQAESRGADGIALFGNTVFICDHHLLLHADDNALLRRWLRTGAAFAEDRQPGWAVPPV